MKSNSSILLICLLPIQILLGSNEFLSFPNESQRSSEICCNDDNLLSCTEVQLNPANLSKKKITLKGIKMTFQNFIEPNGYDYKNSQGDEAILSFHKETGNMFGSLTTHDGRSFAIEKCHHGHVWKEFDVSSFKEDISLDLNGASTRTISDSSAAMSDNDTMVTYSVMFYYTPEVAEATADIEGFIDQVIDETNEGYINSKMPIRVKKFCTELATINDTVFYNPSSLQPFGEMKGTLPALLQTADLATLLVKKAGYCGFANYFNAQYGVSVVKKSCALGYYSFGHEAGHNLGADHNPRVAMKPIKGDGHGHLITPRGLTRRSGYRTIMSYNAWGHRTRVNYWSSPNIIYPVTGTPTGVAGISDNARVITQNRFAVAKYGDESGSCHTDKATTTSTDTTTNSSN